MDSMTSIFAPALSKYTSQLLLRISEDFKIPVDDLNSKYLTSGVPIKPKVPRKPKEATTDRPMCPFLCGNKKTPCKNRCIAGGTGCHLHDPARVLADAAKPKPPKEPKPPKVLKGESLGAPAAPAPAPAPVTINKVIVEEEPEPELDIEPEVEMSMQERLRAMLDQEFDEDEDEEPLDEEDY